MVEPTMLMQLGNFMGGAGSALNAISSLLPTNTSTNTNTNTNTNSSSTTNATATSNTTSRSNEAAAGNTQTGAVTARRARERDSGNTVTTQNNVDDDALMRIANQMLEGNDGLAAILGAEQGSGMYGSAVAGQLTADLMSRIAGEVAKATGSQTVTDTGRERTIEDDSLAFSEQDTIQNRGTTAQQDTTQTSQQTAAAQQQVQQQTQSNTRSRRCFITTAVCEMHGFADNCSELETLRNFRDTWLVQNHSDTIEKYYALAPHIVDYINSRPNAKEIYKYLLMMYIFPAVDAIKKKRYESAAYLYASMVFVCTVICFYPKSKE